MGTWNRSTGWRSQENLKLSDINRHDLGETDGGKDREIKDVHGLLAEDTIFKIALAQYHLSQVTSSLNSHNLSQLIQLT
jgi:hypothetical protein